MPSSHIAESGRCAKSNVSHGFVRAGDGSITTFDVPGAGTGSGQGTNPVCNNPAGAITGYYIDGSGVFHGFLRTSHCHEGDEDRHCERSPPKSPPPG
jgi:hypothetical protein